LIGRVHAEASNFPKYTAKNFTTVFPDAESSGQAALFDIGLLLAVKKCVFLVPGALQLFSPVRGGSE